MEAEKENIVDELVRIEQMASAVLDKLNQNYQQLPKRIQDETSRRVAEIDAGTKRTVETLYRTAQSEVEARTAEITAASEASRQTVQNAFDRNKERWRAELTARVLGVPMPAIVTNGSTAEPRAAVAPGPTDTNESAAGPKAAVAAAAQI